MVRTSKRQSSRSQTEDFQQLQLRFSDHVQWSYELIRPLVLYPSQTPRERAQETQVHPRTVRRHLRYFRHQGMRGLVPELRNMPQWPRSPRVPETITTEVLRLKGLYHGLAYTEIARIIFITQGYAIHHKTVKRILQQHPVPMQDQLPLLDYHAQPHRYAARVQAIKLFYQGWSKQSISRVMHVSRPTLDHLLDRFESEHFAGLLDKSSAPKDPARKVDLSLMVRIYHLQREHPDAGEFRLWSLLQAQTPPTSSQGISRTTVGRIMAVNRLVYDDIPHGQHPTPKGAPAPHPYKAQYRHQYWFIDGRMMDFEIAGVRWWSICILEGYSRTILAGAIAPEEASWIALMVLYTACLRYGAPEYLISDGGGAYTSKNFEAVCQRLRIEHPTVLSRAGESYQNWMETHFNVQRRLYDYKFSQATTAREFERLHEEFIQVYNTTAHQGLLEEGFQPPIPLEVLGQVRGRFYSPEELERKFFQYLFPRTTNQYGCVTLHSYHFYIEAGLPRKRVLLWVYGDRLRAEFDNVVLAEYHCRFDERTKKVQDIRDPRLYQTAFASAQQDLIPLNEQEWITVYRPKSRPARRPKICPQWQLVLFELLSDAA